MGQLIIQYTVGTSGSGKSYIRCARFLVDEYLPYSDGDIISNYPVNIPNIVQMVCDRDKKSKKPRKSRKTFDLEYTENGVFPVTYEPCYYTFPRHGKCCPLVLAARIKIIPESELKQWMTPKVEVIKEGNRVVEKRLSRGPWDYFNEVEISGCHIAIDEVHNFCSKTHPTEWKSRWSQWLGEIRHEGATIEFLTQSESKVATHIDSEASVKQIIYPLANKRNPITGAQFHEDWNVLARFTGVYMPVSVLSVHRRLGSRWSTKAEEVRKFDIEPRYFKAYDSYSASHQGGKKGKSEEQPYKRLSRAQFWAWYFKKNWWRFGIRALGVCGLIYWFLNPNTLHDVINFVLFKKSAQEISEEYKMNNDSSIKVSTTGSASKVDDGGSDEMQKPKRIKLQGVGQNYVFFDGYMHKIGDFIKVNGQGSNEDEIKTIKSINFKERKCLLDDGTVLGM